ncbi:SH3 domain-containing protein [Pseudoduganella flava]|uniref:SH3 domain-containing protein n=1 Tax=Pseudoduganella flava TaxID=871742 RepID=A0A562PNY4_9BURK|nr:SH3 domain-containing protein [Pseudoduganella flava]QGZ40676.1 SH3 domain-containing protein [Pseudoduganella flava]TWI46129.1 SH3 domain-containing protein [Pseudoduganella flava]
MSVTRLIISVALLLASAGAWAAEFKTVGAAPAVLYDAPSTKGSKLFIVPRGTPLEIVLTYGDWVKVRDVAGDLAWTPARALTGRRNVIVRVANAKVRAAEDEASAVVFTADKGVLLELGEPGANGWIKVRHRDGLAGYVRSSDIWGI